MQASFFKKQTFDNGDSFAAIRQDLSDSDSVATNGEKTFTFTMTAPTTPGSYTTD